MAVVAADPSLRLALRYAPAFVADTLVELESNPDDYVGQCVVVLDQPDGKKVYFVEDRGGDGIFVIPAHNMSCFSAEPPDGGVDNDTHYASDGTPITAQMATQYFAATTGGNGQVTVHATSNGAAGGTALFSTIREVRVMPQGIAADLQDRVFAGGYTIASGKSVTAQVLRGVQQAMVLLGSITTVRAAEAGVTVLVAVTGELA